MEPVVVVGGARVFLGDCRDVLKTLPDNSVDSVVTDPPYELGFIGKSWDSSGIAYDVTVWAECLRVLKPGGHVLAFGGSRTWHRLAVAVEDAGFEIRDNIARFYGDPHYCGCEFPEPQMVNWSYGTGEPQAEHGVRSVRDTDISPTLDVETERGKVLQPVVSEQGLSSTKRAESSQGYENGKESSLEGRGDVQATEGELYGGQVRSSAGMGETDGAEGRLHHGASFGDGSDVRVSFDSDGGGESQGSQSGEQSPVESGVVSDERGSQAGRSWPICARCGKPVQPTSSANLAWVMGSGFPKSLDVSKAIDKGQGVNRDRQLQFTAWMRSTGITAEQINEATGTAMASHYLTEKSQPAIATADLFDKLRPYLPEVPEAIERLVAERTGIEWTAYKQREVLDSKWRTPSNKPEFATQWGFGAKSDGNYDITAPSTLEAKAWQGWGTALKPAFEPVVVGRKPFGKGVTVAENVLAWGVGGLNIDGSRIGTSKRVPSSPAKANDSIGTFKMKDRHDQSSGFDPNTGRWPANVILDEVSAGLLDEQSGVSTSGSSGVVRKATSYNANTYGKGIGKVSGQIRGDFGDSGGASRFFYVAKASKRDRNEGLEELETIERKRTMSGGEDTRGRPVPVNNNFHPTVKPTALMRYLIKLVTPPGGTVLDPFTGSGSTGKAALLDGYDFVGAELTEEYLPIIEGRLRWAMEQEGETDERLF